MRVVDWAIIKCLSQLRRIASVLALRGHPGATDNCRGCQSQGETARQCLAHEDVKKKEYTSQISEAWAKSWYEVDDSIRVALFAQRSGSLESLPKIKRIWRDVRPNAVPIQASRGHISM